MFDLLDGEMRRRRIDTILVVGENTLGNPELAYVAGTRIPRGGIFVKRVGHAPLLVVSNIDVGNAKRGRVRDVRTFSEYGYEKWLERYGRERGHIMFIDSLLHSIRTQGRITIYSRNEFSRLLSLADALRKIGYRVVGEAGASIVERMRETKDPAEVEKIRSVGGRAACVARKVTEMLRECKVASGKLKWNKQTLKVGAVKAKINTWLSEQDLIAPEGTVLAVGPSSADPHEMGIPSDPLRAGVPIVLDLFPVGVEGYWFDLTRTFVVGKASPRIRRIFNTVREVQLHFLDTMREGLRARQIMNSACDLFEQRGFKTIRGILRGDQDAARIGFIHSLGHGVGLSIGEKPHLSLFSDDVLHKGQVVTVEPGLYDPSLGGVRIEDTVLIQHGRTKNLTRLDKELEI